MKVTIHPASCFDPRVGLSQLADKSVNHVITDPPYEEHVHAGNRRSIIRGKIVAPVMGFAAITDVERYVSALEFVRLSRGWILVFCGLEGVRPWQDCLVQAGAKRRNTLVWTKPNYSPKFMGDGPAQGSEAIVTAWAGRGRSVWNSGGLSGSYCAVSDRRHRRHCTQKPAGLMRQLIADFTQPGDLILDPYVGGGSTLLAAAELGRKGLGYEIDPEMAELARLTVSYARPKSVLPRRAKSKGG